MENSLIGLVAKAEALQKLVCKIHHFAHSNVVFLQTLLTTELRQTVKYYNYWEHSFNGQFSGELEEFSTE